MNILSLDGGGIRGIITIKLIKAIIEHASKRASKVLHITDLFDFYCGSSVGTLIIATLLLKQDNQLKYTVDEAYDLMIKTLTPLCETTWAQNLQTLWGFRLPKYACDHRVPLFTKLFGTTSFKQLAGDIVFPAGDTMSNQPIYLHNYWPQHEQIPVLDILLGTTAAPTFFPSKELIIDGKKVNLIDTSCVTNNTAQLAFIEAMHRYKTQCDQSQLYVLSIGTGTFKCTYDSKWWGVLSWLPVISSTLIELNSLNQAYELSLMTEKKQIDRIDPLVPSDLDAIDCPQYVPQYIQLTDQWIDNNIELIDQIVTKLLTNKHII